MRPQRDVLRLIEKELKLAPDPELIAELLRDNEAALTAELGVSSEKFRAIVSKETGISVLGDLVRRTLCEREGRRAREARNLAVAAAGMLSRLARWQDDSVELDPRIVLGSLLDDGSTRYLRFDAERYQPVTVRRGKLREARPVLRIFPDLTSCLDGSGLRFRWRAGKGSLLLTSQPVARREAEFVLPVVITRTAPELIERSSPGRHFGDALREATFL